MGRTNNVEMRRCALSAQQNFEVRIEALFFGLGPLEKQVHSALRARQSPIGSEWFAATLKEVLEAIRTTAALKL